MSEVTKNPVPDDYIVPFGKHKGRKIGDVPCAYLLWFLEQDWRMSWPEMHNYVIQNQDSLLEEYEKEYGRSWGQ